MTSPFPQIHLVRHGQTEWSVSGRHTGRTDIELTAEGEIAARRLADRLEGHEFSAVWSSPSLRARRTCELAGFSSAVVIKPNLQEWDYGEYEGVTTKDIHRSNPGWRLFQHGAPGGESASDAGARADDIVAELRQIGSSVLIFSSSHFLRVLGARWLGLPPERGGSFILDTTSISILGYEHDLGEPVIRSWNHVG